MIHLAKKKVRQASANDFDRDPWTLNVENGTVDLRTGALRPHKPEDLLSKMIRAPLRPARRVPTIHGVPISDHGQPPGCFRGENVSAEQLVSYLQRVFGCAATGKPEKILFVLYGEGNNGKDDTA